MNFRIDESGYYAAEDRTHIHALHATMLRLLGFDSRAVDLLSRGPQLPPTDLHRHVAHKIIA